MRRRSPGGRGHARPPRRLRTGRTRQQTPVSDGGRKQARTVAARSGPESHHRALRSRGVYPIPGPDAGSDPLGASPARKSHSKSQRRPSSGDTQLRQATVEAGQVPSEPSPATSSDAREVTGGQGVAGSNPAVPTDQSLISNSETGPLSADGSATRSHQFDEPAVVARVGEIKPLVKGPPSPAKASSTRGALVSGSKAAPLTDCTTVLRSTSPDSSGLPSAPSLRWSTGPQGRLTAGR
jgi:hypothetical protein